MFTSGFISLAFVIVLALLLKNAVLYILSCSLVFGLMVPFLNVTSSVIMNLDGDTSVMCSFIGGGRSGLLGFGGFCAFWFSPI